MAKLGEVCLVQSGGTPSRSKQEYWNNGIIPWVKISDIKSKYLNETEEFITEEGINNSSAKIFPKGTLLYTIFATLGEVCVLNIDASTNQAIAGIQIVDEKIDSDYLYYFLCSLKNQVNQIGRGVAQNNINMSILRNIEVPIPDKETQQMRSAVLSLIDKQLRMRNKQLQLLDELVKSRFIEMFGDPVLNPKGWEKVSLSDIAELKIGPFGSLLHKEDYCDYQHPVINPSHIVGGKIIVDNNLTVTNDKYEELYAYHLKIGDVVLGRRGEMGRCAVVESDNMLCGTGSLLIRPIGELRADFIQKIISFPTFKKTIEDMAVGQTMPNLNVPIVSSFQIIKPPIDVQEKYYDFVAQVDKSKLAVQKSLEQLEILKKSLMQAYFG